MITCSHCRQTNHPGAFFCKFCGTPLACPRCRLLLQDPAAFCDNCGQALVNDAEMIIVPHAHHHLRPDENVLLENQPGSRQFHTHPNSNTQQPAASSPSYLDQFVPQELKNKLQAAQTNSRMIGERRVVTMLFCDVKGSTAAAEKLDPEEWTEIINGAFEFMIKPIYKYEGIVARLMGDAILAFFGAPIAHEDDPERAVLAGLDILAGIKSYRQIVLDKWGITLELRVGINTGMVVVGAVGSDLRMEYTAMGDAVNLASRMEQTAEPGTVQITEETYKLVASHFEIQDLGSIVIKGKEEPVPIFRVLSHKAGHTRLKKTNETALPIVGRDESLMKTISAMEKVRQGNGQILFITGEVGLGKSRLIEELHQAWDRTAPNSQEAAGEGLHGYSRWFETFSLSYETTQPYALFRHFLLQLIGATQGDPPAALAQKLSDFLSGNVPEAQMATVKAVLEALFGLAGDDGTALEGEQFKKQLYETITALLTQWAEGAPGVIVTDDIHWADPASIDLLQHLFGLSDQLPILFVCAMRPDRQSSAWQLHDKTDRQYPHRFTEIRLEPLSPEKSRFLISHLLHNNDLPQDLVDNILAKAAGNPFFIEEVVRALIDQGSVIPNSSKDGWDINPDIVLNQIAIPDSLQSTLMARIDRLDEAQRTTLQMAALIGQSFYYRVLNYLIGKPDQIGIAAIDSLDQQLGDLQRMELIVQVARLPELEYVFRQTLVQESAYKMILHKQRRQYHLKVGEAIEALYPELLDKHAVVLATHFTLGGDYARSLKYHTIAADSAYRLYAVAEAIEHYTQALEAVKMLTKGEPSQAAGVIPVETLTHIYARRGRALELNTLSEEAIANYEAMRQKAQLLNSPEMELSALMAMATQYATPTSFYNFDLAESLSQQALLLAQELHDRPAEAKILWNLSNMNRLTGKTEKALETGEHALAIARELDLREQMAYSLNDLCHLYNRTGQYAKTKAALQETIQLWRDLNNLPMLADSLSTASYLYTYTGDYDEAVTFSDEALEISKTIDNIWGISYSQWMVGRVFWERGAADRAIRMMTDSIHNADKAGFIVAQVYTRADLALITGFLGDVNRGKQIANEALSVIVNNPLLFEPFALNHLARLHLMNGDTEAAAAAIAKIGDRHVYVNRPKIVNYVACELALVLGNALEAVQLLTTRTAELRSYQLISFLPETLHLLGRALKAANQPDKAITVLEEGLETARRIGSRWTEWQLLLALAELKGGEQAVFWRAQALEITVFIAENVSDPALHLSFLNRPDIQELTGGVTDLSKLKMYAANWLNYPQVEA